MEIRKHQDADWGQVWPINEKVFRSGDALVMYKELKHKIALDSDVAISPR